MSQVTEQSVRFQTALASIKLIQASAVLDLTEDDFDFLTSNKDRKSGSAGMPRPISYAVFCLKKKNDARHADIDQAPSTARAPRRWRRARMVHEVRGKTPLDRIP